MSSCGEGAYFQASSLLRGRESVPCPKCPGKGLLEGALWERRVDQEGRRTAAWDTVGLGRMGLQAPHVSCLPLGRWEGLFSLFINTVCLETGCFSSSPVLSLTWFVTLGMSHPFSNPWFPHLQKGGWTRHVSAPSAAVSPLPLPPCSGSLLPQGDSRQQEHWSKREPGWVNKQPQSPILSLCPEPACEALCYPGQNSPSPSPWPYKEKGGLWHRLQAQGWGESCGLWGPRWLTRTRNKSSATHHLLLATLPQSPCLPGHWERHGWPSPSLSQQIPLLESCFSPPPPPAGLSPVSRLRIPGVPSHRPPECG